MTSPSGSTSSSRSSTPRRKAMFLQLTCKRPLPHLTRRNIRLLDTRCPAQRLCSTRRWSPAGRSAGRPSLLASRGVLGLARRRRRQAAKLGHLTHSRHLLAMTMTACFSYVCNFNFNFILFCNM
jgi:hypothetical protein